jgi:hypothetical protein
MILNSHVTEGLPSFIHTQNTRICACVHELMRVYKEVVHVKIKGGKDMNILHVI